MKFKIIVEHYSGKIVNSKTYDCSVEEYNTMLKVVRGGVDTCGIIIQDEQDNDVVINKGFFSNSVVTFVVKED